VDPSVLRVLLTIAAPSVAAVSRASWRMAPLSRSLRHPPNATLVRPERNLKRRTSNAAGVLGDLRARASGGCSRCRRYLPAFGVL
jgi:hypothetical protein